MGKPWENPRMKVMNMINTENSLETFRALVGLPKQILQIKRTKSRKKMQKREGAWDIPPIISIMHPSLKLYSLSLFMAHRIFRP
jgi:hypothetical protein